MNNYTTDLDRKIAKRFAAYKLAKKKEELITVVVFLTAFMIILGVTLWLN